MSTKQRKMRCSAEDVFAVLGNGWLYPGWVVGASRMRDVDEAWPAPDTRLEHSVGVWPALIDDTTSCREWDPPHRMVLQARGWPLGEARVEIEATDVESQRGRPGCRVRITERGTKGAAKLLPKPLFDLVVGVRNVETLRRLAYLAEGGAGEPTKES